MTSNFPTCYRDFTPPEWTPPHSTLLYSTPLSFLPYTIKLDTHIHIHIGMCRETKQFKTVSLFNILLSSFTAMITNLSVKFIHNINISHNILTYTRSPLWCIHNINHKSCDVLPRQRTQLLSVHNPCIYIKQHKGFQ